jgi:hypothetical protein
MITIFSKYGPSIITQHKRNTEFWAQSAMIEKWEKFCFKVTLSAQETFMVALIFKYPSHSIS